MYSRDDVSDPVFKFIFGWDSAPDPTGGAHDAPPDPLVGWGGGYPLPIPIPARDAFRRLELGGSQAPSTQNPGVENERLSVVKYRGLLFLDHRVSEVVCL